VSTRTRSLPACLATTFALWGLPLSPVACGAESSPALPLQRAMAAAEDSLRRGANPAAEAHYRSALLEGWLLKGALDRADARLPAARDAYSKASALAAGERRALVPLAAVRLQMGEAAEAVAILAPLARERPNDVECRRLLGHALVAAGRPQDAVRELEEARASAPADLEVAFALGGAYLGAKDSERAARVFEGIVQARPIPQTRVLVARTYREFGEYARARGELRAALEQDPRTRNAHYYLGMLAVTQDGRAGIEQAVAEFRAELKLEPEDPLASLELGVALVEGRREQDALPALEVAARSGPQARTLYYLGRAQLALGRAADAAASLKRALELASAQGANVPALRAIHVQLGQAFRTLADPQASHHFAEAERLSALGAGAEREQLARYMAGGSDAAPAVPIVPLIGPSPLEALAPQDRRALGARVSQALARCYMNLGVLETRRERFSEGAQLFEQAAAIEPDFPRLQSSLGVAYFNARQFEKATGPLTRAVAADPEDAGLKRMLAMAWLNTRSYANAARLLQDDPERDADPSLQFAYGLALVKSDRAAEAEQEFSKLLARHGGSAELSVLLGQAHAQQGDYDAAIASLEHALRLKADVAEAYATLGEIYLRQGRLADAETALRAELEHHHDDLQSRQHLAIVLDSQQRPEEAIALLRGVLQAQPDFPNARYLLGKMLLAQGAPSEAEGHLEAAARLAPEDANVAYQLWKAYQTLGRAELARQQFELYRRLKDER
jgi:tetratricopeptide (TPR) repeat protein